MPGDDEAQTEHVRMPMPPGGDADRHPGSPDIGEPDPDPETSEKDESSGHPHSGRRHDAAGDAELPGESGGRHVVRPPGER
ncbi:hypothetical protein [Saccharothrix deserti]|uniref:hypothetical protein n=1 Tax=Saccharothrix deserti TaxID=2593674 RepID=UPI00131EC86F|nr:hypothetical protein [Saccharothrix deserti]